jgi:nucleotide-binding universal stress UspA family protein
MSTILVGIDGSSASRAALAWAARRAALLGSSLVIAHVVDDEWGSSADQLLAAERELALRAADVAESFPALDIDVLVAAGNPSIELATIASRADLLVLGTHKTGFVQGHVFGSRALRLAASSDAPVAVIPERTTGIRSGVVVGIDSSAAGDAAVHFAAIEAQRLGEELILVLGTGAVEPGEVRAPQRAERELGVVARAVRIADATSPDVAVRVRTVRRAPSSALVGVAGRARLLVVGSSRRHGEGAAALGPVSHDVLLNIAAPTVVVHPARLGVASAVSA